MTGSAHPSAPSTSTAARAGRRRSAAGLAARLAGRQTRTRPDVKTENSYRGGTGAHHVRRPAPAGLRHSVLVWRGGEAVVADDVEDGIAELVAGDVDGLEIRPARQDVEGLAPLAGPPPPPGGAIDIEG